MGKREARGLRKALLWSGYALILLGILALLVRSIFLSLFIQGKERINIISYKDTIAFYSLGNADRVSYLVYFAPDQKVFVPGGYRYYRFGALGKLVLLDNKPQILKKAFSSATSTFIDYYFYPNKPEVIYGRDTPSAVELPGFSDIFFARTNASFIDRIYMYLKFRISKKSDYTTIKEIGKKEKGESIFKEDGFAKKYQGFFYQKTYRTEKQTVQIIYTKQYKNALLISRILEGNGIHVVDMSPGNFDQKSCSVAQDSKKYSRTARDLSRFFHCPLIRQKTKTSDIIFMLGKIEDEWEAE
ncbi:hypothetical protein HYT33_04725 [Candidatus Roizmanbacteria bacterium]|nr:hypothetical protein [Candidatus Roizmanbacteria bacterium]